MSQGISREALLIYLNDIRMMETLIVENQKKLPKLQTRKNNMKLIVYDAPISPIEPDKNPKKPTFFLLNISKTVRWAIIKNLFFGLLFIVLSILLLKSFLVIVTIIIAYIFLWDAFLKAKPYVKKYKEDLKNYENLIETYDDRVEQYNKNLQNYNKQLEQYNKNLDRATKKLENDKNKITTLINTVNDNIVTTQKNLQQAYSLNIIPAPYRNIQSIYYLYEYLSTSNESLTSALTHADLESIKQKLDKMISLQGTMIIQQAQANRALFEQNQRILEAARNIENNSAVAAQYSQISAINSEVSLILQAESLAYQEADFWLRYN